MIRVAKAQTATIASHVRSIVGASILALAGATWLQYDRTPPFELDDGEITPRQVRGGERINATWHTLTRLRGGSYDFTCTRWIFDRHKHPRRAEIQEIKDTLVPQSESIQRDVIVHYETGWGPAFYRQECCYSWNALITTTRREPICVRRPDLPFEVLPPPPK